MTERSCEGMDVSTVEGPAASDLGLHNIEKNLHCRDTIFVIYIYRL